MMFYDDNYRDEDIKIQNEPDDVFTYIDLCSGIGGFHVAMNNIPEVQSKCILACDINADCRKTYYRNYGIPCHRDITKLDLNKLENIRIDAVFGGFPCQPFSSAGKKLGIDDTRGTIVYHIFKIIQKTNPKYIILENVIGLTQKKHTELFENIKYIIHELGYNVQVHRVNTISIGIPQDRPRILFRCVRNDLVPPMDALPDTGRERKLDFVNKTIWEFLDKTDTRNNLSNRHKKAVPLIGLYVTMHCPSKPNQIFIGFLKYQNDLDSLSPTKQSLVLKNLELYQNNTEFKKFIDIFLSENDISELLPTQLTWIFDMDALRRGEFNKIIIHSRQSGMIIRRRDYIPTLTKTGYRPIVVYNRVTRYLNDKELLELQSFPSNFEYLSSSILQQQIGNSVNCKVIEDFLRRTIFSSS